jgi:hypothetical protein
MKKSKFETTLSVHPGVATGPTGWMFPCNPWDIVHCFERIQKEEGCTWENFKTDYPGSDEHIFSLEDMIKTLFEYKACLDKAEKHKHDMAVLKEKGSRAHPSNHYTKMPYWKPTLGLYNMIRGNDPSPNETRIRSIAEAARKVLDDDVTRWSEAMQNDSTLVNIIDGIVSIYEAFKGSKAELTPENFHFHETPGMSPPPGVVIIYKKSSGPDNEIVYIDPRYSEVQRLRNRCDPLDEKYIEILCEKCKRNEKLSGAPRNAAENYIRDFLKIINASNPPHRPKKTK